MIGSILIVISLLWLTLAVAVGFHARGHNRSGIIWFIVILISGIFGFGFYLLAITTNKSNESNWGRELDRRIIRKGPKLVLTSVVGAVAVFLVGYIWAELSVGFNPESESFVSLIMVLSFVGGAVGSPYIAFNQGWRRWGYLLSYTPVLILGVVGGLTTPNALFGVSQTDLSILQRAVSGAGGAGLCGFLWFYLYQNIIQIESPAIWQKAQREFNRHRGRKEINISRRKSIALVGGSATLLIGGVAYIRNPKPNLSIEETSVRYSSGGGTVIITMNNPRTVPVTVEIETFVQVVEIDGGVSGTRNEREEFVTSVSGVSTIPPESIHRVKLGYEVDEQDTLVNLQLAEDAVPSFSIQTDRES
ncbi:hypothetical protein [Haloferax volcanii]|uniref:hypothetical protein n=1 Tax=Haloferax volcanii TaxID=2246 RepID=UPI0038551C3F